MLHGKRMRLTAICTTKRVNQISSTRQTLMNIDNMGMSPAVFPRRTLSQYRNVVTDTVCGVYNNNEASISSDHSSYNNFHVPYWRL